jgi:hypothetical protein
MTTEMHPGWLSIARWPADRERHGPIQHVFCSPTCTTAYLTRVAANGSYVQYPRRKEAAR